MHGVEVRLLGPVEVLAGGRAVEPGPVQQRTVLAALAVDAGRLVPLEVLIDRVWETRRRPACAAAFTAIWHGCGACTGSAR